MVSSEKLEGTSLTPSEYYTMGMMLTAEAILGILFSGSLLLVFLRNDALHRPQAVLGITLCIADLGIAMLCPFAALASFQETWPFGDRNCQLYAFFGMLFGTVSISAMTSLALDKYYSTAHCVRAGKSNPYVFVASLIWLNALFWSIVPLPPIGWGRYGIEPPKTTCMLDFANHDTSYMTYLTAMICVVYIVPVGAILLCLMKLRKDTDRIKGENNGVKKETTVTCILVLLSLVMYWGAYGIVAVWAALDDIDNVPLRLVAAAPIVAKICPIGNAMLQVLTNPNIRVLMHGIKATHVPAKQN